jgi:hypothetical protein
MKMVVTMTALLLVAAAPADTGGRPFQDLGEQFVNSLRNQDIVEFSQCWISHRRVRTIIIASKAPDSEINIKAMKGYLENRNRQVAKSFKRLTERFKKDGDITRLKLVSIEAHVLEVYGIRKTSKFHVTISLDDVTYKLKIDDGFQDSGTWYFFDPVLGVH